jgi:hypothetical protein
MNPPNSYLQPTGNSNMQPLPPTNFPFASPTFAPIRSGYLPPQMINGIPPYFPVFMPHQPGVHFSYPSQMPPPHAEPVPMQTKGELYKSILSS